MFRKTPGSSSAKIAVARERAQQPVERVRVGAGLLGELGDGARAAASFWAMPRSETIPSARVTSAPRSASQRSDSGARSLIRGPC